MLSWRLKIREAKMALKEGRPQDAGRILQRESVRDFLPAKRLSCEVAEQLIERAQQRFELGDSNASWSDLQEAARLGGCEQRVSELRQAQTRRGLDRVQDLLLRGETRLAAEQIARLEQRRLGGDDRRAWKLVVHLIARAKEFQSKGKLTDAVDMLDRAVRLLPSESPSEVSPTRAEPNDELADMIVSRIDRLQQQRDELRQLTGQLHEALSKEDWTNVLTTADAVLELAPEHTAARNARRRAWDVVGMQATRVPQYKKPRTAPPRHDERRERTNRIARSLASTHAWKSSVPGDTKTMEQKAGKRLVTWIDGVGGYLLCLADEVTLGQPAGGGNADIPILADLSRRHATIRREGEAYIISPIHRVVIDGQELSGPQVLKDGALIQLGDAVRMKFSKPHALSSTAVLSLESHHKTEPAVDGIILMSESCVLGASPQSHIPCRKWEDDLVLFRRDDQLQFRTAAAVEVNDEPASGSPSSGSLAGGASLISDRTRINGETFSLSFEEI